VGRREARAMIAPAALVLPAAAIAGLVVAVALALGTVEWLSWRLARRAGLPLPGARSWSDWLGGLAGLLHPDADRAEAGASLGFAIVVFGAFLPTSVLASELWRGAALAPATARLGLLALSPLLVALGYAIAAERASGPSRARQRLGTAARIAFALPGWLVATALASASHGDALPLATRALLALALVGTGLFVLPGAAAEQELTSRTWGGDPTEPSATVRFLTGVAQYAGLAGVSGIAASTLTGGAPDALSLVLALLLALALRAAAALPRGGAWVRQTAAWSVPVLLAAYALAGAGGAGATP